MEGRIYGTIDDKMGAVNAHLREMESDAARVRPLAGWDWISAVSGVFPHNSRPVLSELVVYAALANDPAEPPAH